MAKKDEIVYKNLAAKLDTYERFNKMLRPRESSDDLLRRLLDAAELIRNADDSTAVSLKDQNVREAKRILAP